MTHLRHPLCIAAAKVVSDRYTITAPSRDLDEAGVRYMLMSCSGGRKSGPGNPDICRAQPVEGGESVSKADRITTREGPSRHKIR
jgi:hypothetical protein